MRRQLRREIMPPGEFIRGISQSDWFSDVLKILTEHDNEKSRLQELSKRNKPMVQRAQYCLRALQDCFQHLERRISTRLCLVFQNFSTCWKQPCLARKQCWGRWTIVYFFIVFHLASQAVKMFLASQTFAAMKSSESDMISTNWLHNMTVILNKI